MRHGAEVLRAKAVGLDGFIAEPDPLLPAGERAIHAWNFCGGWAPERLPLYVALHGADNLAELVDLMSEIAAHLNEPRTD